MEAPSDPKVTHFYDRDSMRHGLLLDHLLFKLPAVTTQGPTHLSGAKAKTFWAPQMYNTVQDISGILTQCSLLFGLIADTECDKAVQGFKYHSRVN